MTTNPYISKPPKNIISKLGPGKLDNKKLYFWDMIQPTSPWYLPDDAN